MSATRRHWLLISVSTAVLSLTIIGLGCSSVPAASTTSTTTTTKTVTAIAVTPSTMSVNVGAAQQFTATATYSDGSNANVSSTATWTSSTPAFATVNASGDATAVAAGSTTITASLSGVSGTAALTVTAPTKSLSTIAVTPNPASLTIGATQQFTATGTYSDGSTANVTSSASWTSSTPAVATISSSGLATAVASGSSNITASLSGVTSSPAAALTVSAAAASITSIAVSVASPSIAVDTADQLTATATYTDGSTAPITSSATWTSSDPTVAFVDSAGLAGGLLAGSSTITASYGGVNGTASLTVTGSGVNVPLFHVDPQRTGLNASEGILSPTTVGPSSGGTSNFGKLFSYTLDGYEYGQPLLVSNLTISGAKHNVVFAATENDSVYAFDSDNYGTGSPLWKTSLLRSGETAMTDGPIQPVQGVTGTPAINLATNTMYVVSAQTSSAAGPTFRLNALNISTGAQQSGSPVTITASAAGANGGPLTTACIQRAALLVSNGYVYIGFGGCPNGWFVAYQETNLAAPPVTFNSSPNLPGEGAYASAGGVWMGGGGPVADSSGNIYISTGNGPWNPSQSAWSDSVLKFNAASSSSSMMVPVDYFTPAVYEYMDCSDADMAAGGLLLIPGTTEVVAGGKMGELYLLNTTNLGQESTGDTGATYFTFFEPDLVAPFSKSCTDVNNNTWTTNVNVYEIFGTAAYFNGSVYLGITPTDPSGIPAMVREFPYSATSSTPLALGNYAAPDILEGSYGYTVFITANGTSDGIVWILDHGQPLQSPGTPSNASLVAYDSGLAIELYNSTSNSADTPGYGIKFSAPMAANGKVYIATGQDTVGTGELDVYGLK